jgi:AraC-like DNA-binding protein
MSSIHVRVSGRMSDIQQRQRIIRRIEDALVPLGAEHLRASIWCVIEKDDDDIAGAEQGPAEVNRAPALSGALVERALDLMHADPLRPWSLAMLSAEAGASRSSLAKRFSGAMGCSPIQYLKRLRMLVAAKRLTERNVRIAAVAEEAGYESEAAFSRAFKRFAGCAPGKWRSTRSDQLASHLDAEGGRQNQIWTIGQGIAPNGHSPARDFRLPSGHPHDPFLSPHSKRRK